MVYRPMPPAARRAARRESHLLVERIRSLWVEYLIAGHDRHKVLCLGKIDDVVSPSRNLVDFEAAV